MNPLTLLEYLIDSIKSHLFAAMLGLFTGIVIAVLVEGFRSKYRFSRAYHIAVVGFPQSGKTTLITSLFNELFSGKILRIKIVPRGSETIEKINRDIARLEIGESLGPTTDQDLFAYRADVNIGRFPFSTRYKIEIGDFPGEDSTEFTEKFGDWFHNTPYFKWVMEADAFIFIIDTAHVLADDDQKSYRAKITKAIRAAWQHIQEYHIEGKKDLKSKPIVLVFAKGDLLVVASHIRLEDQDDLTNTIRDLGFGKTFPKPVHYIDFDIDKRGALILLEYRRLIDYLRHQTNKFGVVFASHFAFCDNGRMGINDILKRILPR
jgi:GTPase SAR1 family protein